ncbi:MAG TPA: ATP-binding protein [Polyangiaceae bacterium]|nr:ATP-binding protein [Polyangiaceae bacterium]
MSVKILFVDDDEANLVVCEAACADTFEVLTASSAEAALEHMHREEVGVIVADQRMPGTSGVELLERVRLEYPDTVRLLITAYTDVQAAVAAINRGRVRRYLRKPWEPDELRAELTDALDVYSMTRKLSAMEVRLRETERVYALGVVAASIAHEMKNPMMWVTNSLSFAQRELRRIAEHSATGSVKQQIEEIEASLTDTRTGVDRVVDIVRGIEMPTRSDSGALRPTDFAEVLRLSLRLVSGELMRCASLELDVTCAPKVKASPTKLGQVVLNLIVNAMQAISARPRAQNVISVRLRVEDAWAVLQVADNGPGIADADIDRIFDPFFTSKVGVGTGLGLAISRRIVEEIEGSLIAGRDERLGGASFIVRLPL